MVDGDTVEPGAPGGISTKLIAFAKGFEKHVVCRVFGFLRIPQKPKRQIIDRTAVFLVKLPEFSSCQRRSRAGGFSFCQWLAHKGPHPGLDRILQQMSRR